MAEVILGDTQTLESTTIGIYRTATVVKGGRRFSFGALVVVGDRRGSVGIGYGKAPGVPAAIEKAQKEARKKMSSVILEGGTLPHTITSRFSASIVRLVPAAPGTGVIAGATVRAVLELVGVRDCLTKVYGSSNPKNLCRATLAGLMKLRTRAQVEELRGVDLGSSVVEKRLEAGRRYASVTTMSTATGGPPAPRPAGHGQPRRGGRKKPGPASSPVNLPSDPESAAPDQRAANQGSVSGHGTDVAAPTDTDQAKETPS